MEQIDPFCVEGTTFGPEKEVRSIHNILIWGCHNENWVGVQQVWIHISG